MRLNQTLTQVVVLLVCVATATGNGVFLGNRAVESAITGIMYEVPITEELPNSDSSPCPAESSSEKPLSSDGFRRLASSIALKRFGEHPFRSPIERRVFRLANFHFHLGFDSSFACEYLQSSEHSLRNGLGAPIRC